MIRFGGSNTKVSAIVLLAMLSSSCFSQVIEDNPADLKGMDIEEKLGQQIPMDLRFVNDKGDTVALGNYFTGDKPALLVLAYYSCPMLCNLVLNGVNKSLRELSYTPGDNFRFLTVSFDPRETYELAAAKKKNYVGDLGRAGSDSGWTFFVGEENQSRALADAVGFHYFWDETTKQYAHPAVVFVLTPNGTISRYLYGIEFPSRDVKLALLEASEGKTGNTIDRLLLYCYHYDPDSRGYVVFAGNIMRLGGAMTVAVLSLFLIRLWLRERRKKSMKLPVAQGSA
jgi:protein SCO1/2